MDAEPDLVADSLPGGDADPVAELLPHLRRALRSASPLDLMQEVSAGIELTAADPAPEPGAAVCGCGAPADCDPRAGLLAVMRLVDQLAATPVAETTAAIRLIRDFSSHEELADHANDALRGCRHPLPVWLAHLDEARIEGEVFRTLGTRGCHERLVWGLRLAGGARLTAQVFMDREVGGALCDVSVCDVPLEVLMDAYRQAEEGRVTTEPVEAAATRVLVEHAMSAGLCVFPGMQSTTWPLHRPAVLWALRLMPGSARGTPV